MDYKILFVIISSVLTIASVIPYLVEIVRKQTKPRIVSWFIWSVITGIAAVAALYDNQYATAVLLFSAMSETLAVVIFGWKNGDKKILTLDIVCFIGAIVGIILWVIFNSPAVAVIATILIDFIGGIPTLVHSWKKPSEETWITFMACFFASLLTIATLSDWRITSAAYPIYLVFVNLEFTLVIVLRKKYLELKKR